MNVGSICSHSFARSEEAYAAACIWIKRHEIVMIAGGKVCGTF